MGRGDIRPRSGKNHMHQAARFHLRKDASDRQPPADNPAADRKCFARAEFSRWLVQMHEQIGAKRYRRVQARVVLHQLACTPPCCPPGQAGGFHRSGRVQRPHQAGWQQRAGCLPGASDSVRDRLAPEFMPAAGLIQPLQPGRQVVGVVQIYPKSTERRVQRGGIGRGDIGARYAQEPVRRRPRSARPDGAAASGALAENPTRARPHPAGFNGMKCFFQMGDDGRGGRHAARYNE